MEYVLDIDKWRCGGDSENMLGIGTTEMLNKEGYMCCLGQFAKQQGVGNKSLRFEGDPEDVAGFLYTQKKKTVYDPAFVYKTDAGSFCNTPLTDKLIDINDDPITTPSEKIKLLRKELKKAGHTLIVKGKVPK